MSFPPSLPALSSANGKQARRCFEAVEAQLPVLLGERGGLRTEKGATFNEF